MEKDRFDAFTQSLGQAGSRRTLLSVVVASLFGATAAEARKKGKGKGK
jgi:hypothetical protein